MKLALLGLLAGAGILAFACVGWWNGPPYNPPRLPTPTPEPTPNVHEQAAREFFEGRLGIDWDGQVEPYLEDVAEIMRAALNNPSQPLSSGAVVITCAGSDAFMIAIPTPPWADTAVEYENEPPVAPPTWPTTQPASPTPAPEEWNNDPC